jgi:hypothetical protein
MIQHGWKKRVKESDDEVVSGFMKKKSCRCWAVGQLPENIKIGNEDKLECDN